jgi:hypothetical protein
VRAQAQHADLLLAAPVGELDSDDVWLSNEARVLLDVAGHRARGRFPGRVAAMNAV